MTASLSLTLQRVEVPIYTEGSCVPLIQKITVIVHLKYSSYIDDRYSEFQNSKTFRNHLIVVKTLLQISSAKISDEEKSRYLTNVEQLILFQFVFSSKVLLCLKVPFKKQYLWANNVCPTEIIVLLYFNSHFTELETELRKVNPSISLSMMQLW